MKQEEMILKAMLENPTKEVWDARDFQRGAYFVGYEATARMSELARKYPSLIKVGKDGRYRTLSINWEDKEIINFLRKLLEIEGE